MPSPSRVGQRSDWLRFSSPRPGRLPVTSRQNDVFGQRFSVNMSPVLPTGVTSNSGNSGPT